MTSGNKIVDAVSELHINSIPEAWYMNIRKHNQPNALAILVLYDLIYWYKWTEVRDESTGCIIALKKKFKADLLQRNYAQIAARFGISKKVATSITDDLVAIGVIKKHFRTIEAKGLKIANVLFIEVVPEVLKNISALTKIEESSTPEKVDGIPQSGDTLIPDEGDGGIQSGDTNTITTTTDTTTNTTIPLSAQSSSEADSTSESSSVNQSANSISLAEREELRKKDEEIKELRKIVESLKAEKESKPVKKAKTRKTKTDEELQTLFSEFSETDIQTTTNCINNFIAVKQRNDPRFMRSRNQLDNWSYELLLFSKTQNRDLNEVATVWNWAINDHFWSSNINSVSAFTKKYESLIQKCNSRQNRGYQSKPKYNAIDFENQNYNEIF